MNATSSSFRLTWLSGLALSTALLSGTALAEEPMVPGIAFEVGGGASFAARFEGSKNYDVSPYPIIRFGYLKLDNGFIIGGGDDQGLSFKPSFAVRGERNSIDNPELAGLNDVDLAIELGLGVKYTMGDVSAFSAIRYGVFGHESLVGELGADYTYRVNEQLSLTAGPRASWASADYMETYFGVTALEAAGSSFAEYTPKAGFKSVGVEASLRYDFNNQWAMEAGLGYNLLVGDAADSPIVAAGSKNQYTGRLGFSRKFQIDF